MYIFLQHRRKFQNIFNKIIGFPLGKLPTKYLGTLLALNHLNMVNWQQNIEKLTSRLENWSFRTLNLARRVILVKEVLQLIPIYQLSAMTTPKGVHIKMVEIFKEFL